MKTNKHQWLFTLITVFTVITFLATSSFAETPQSTSESNTGQTGYPGMGPGHMGYGGMWPGHMGYGGMGYGGMGYGSGMGMMGYGMGYGMGFGGMGMMQALNLDKSQRDKIRSLMRAQRTANCKTMNEMMDVRDELAAEYDKPQQDAKAIGKLYNKMEEMRRHMIEQSVQMHNQIRELLNKEQKDTYDQMYHGGMGYGGMWNMMQ